MRKPDVPGGEYKAGDRVQTDNDGPGTVTRLHVMRNRISYRVDLDNGGTCPNPNVYPGSQLTAL